MSLEGYHLELLAKLKLASDFVDVFRNHPVKCNPMLLKDINPSSVPFMVNQREFIDDIDARIETIKTNYLMAIVGAVDDYYSGRNPDLAVKHYYETLSFVDTPHLVNEILRNINNEIEKYSFDNKHHLSIIQRLRDSIKTPLKMVSNKQQSNLCDCGAQLMITNHGNEYYCSNCGCLTYIEAVASSSQRNESNSSHHGNKFDELWTRLMGVEQWEPNSAEDKIIGGYLQQNYTPHEINSYVVRRVIETLSKQHKEISTSLYKHISSLVRLYGKHPPPSFTHDETRKIRIMFNIINDAAEKHKKKISASFIIYKIIESEFQGNHEKLRMLQFIHSKSHKTMSKYNDDFNYICSLSNKVNLNQTNAIKHHQQADNMITTQIIYA